MNQIKILVKIYGNLMSILCFLEILETKLHDAGHFDILYQINDMELDLRIMDWISNILKVEPELELFILPELLIITTDNFELSDFGLEEREISFNLSEIHYTFSKLLGNIINIKVLLMNEESIPNEFYQYQIDQLIFFTKNLKDITKSNS